MDAFTYDTFANRDEPIPVLAFDPVEPTSEHESSERERKRDRLKAHGQNFKESLRKAQGKATETGSTMQDRLLEKLLQQVIPIEDPDSTRDNNTSSPSDFITRPTFSLPTMSTNFRRFNSRIGVVFVFQAHIIRLLSWKKPTHTLSFLATYTFICLDPYLLSVLPLALLLLALLIPAFIARHPAAHPIITPQTSSNINSFQYSTAGPPLAPAPTVKPVKELSKDFFRNMRDLQNSMEDFSLLHDKVISLLTPPTNFSNEPLSSTLFLFTVFAGLLLFIASHLLPWRFIFLVLGWTVTGMGHPTIQRQLLLTHQQLVVPHEEQAKSWLDSWITSDIILDTDPDTREVEIFELQYQPSPGPAYPAKASTSEWQSWLFSSSPYDPLSTPRLRGNRPLGTRFFEDVQPPQGWEWSEKKWALDLWSREWVEERIITGVEVETEGERWVYDIRYEYEEFGEAEGRNSDGDGLVYGEGASETVKNGKRRAKVLPSWEEGEVAEGEGRGRRGEWRRRRWVRMVKRKWQNSRERSDSRSRF